MDLFKIFEDYGLIAAAGAAMLLGGFWGLVYLSRPFTDRSIKKALAEADRIGAGGTPAPGPFFGRREELAEVSDVLRRRGTIALEGVGGIGKTRLALQAAVDNAARFSGGRVFVDLLGTTAPLSTADAMAAVLTYPNAPFDIPERMPEGKALATFYRDQLARHHDVLLILDNADDGAQVAPLQPPVGVACIITARRPVVLPGVTRRDIDAIDSEAARHILLSFGRPAGARKADLDAVAEACFRVPLALDAAGRSLGEGAYTVAEFLDRLRADRPGKLEAVMRALDLSWRRALAEAPAAAAPWPLLAAFPATFSGEAAAKVCGVEDGVDLLAGLHRLGLVERMEGGGDWRLHDLMRDLARQTADPDALAAARDRHAEWIADLLAGVSALFLAGHQIEALARFDRHRADIDTAFAWTDLGGSDERRRIGLRLTREGAIPSMFRLSPRERVVRFEAAIDAARALGELAAEVESLQGLGNAWIDAGEPRRAIEAYEQGLAISRVVGDASGEGAFLGSLGIAWVRLGDIGKAVEVLKPALAIARRLGRRQGVITALINLGGAWATLGQIEKAIGANEEVVALAREAGDHHNEGIALGNLGAVWGERGEWQKAITYHEQHLASAKTLHDLRGEVRALGNLGACWAPLGDREKAMRYYDRSLDLARAIGERHEEGRVLGNLAYMAWDIGARDEAFATAEQALAILDTVESPHAARLRGRIAEWRMMAEVTASP